MTHKSDTAVDELKEMLASYKPHRKGSHSDDWGGESDNPCFCDLEAKLLAWRDKHTAKMVREARIDELHKSLYVGSDDCAYCEGTAYSAYHDTRMAQLTTNKKAPHDDK